jgi:hypothetical protein
LQYTVNQDSSITLFWTAAQGLYTSVERYAIFWSATNFTTDGWAWGHDQTYVTIPAEVLSSSAGIGKNLQFKIRADNDTFAIYSAWSNTVEVYIPLPPTPAPLGIQVYGEGQDVTIIAPQENQRINQVVAWYGDPNDGNCGAYVSSTISDAANGLYSYSFPVTNDYFSNDPCSGISKVLVIQSVDFLTVMPPSPTPEEIAAEQARIAAEQAAAAEAARIAAEQEAARIAAEQAAQAAAAEAARLEAERIAAEAAAAEAARIAAEAAAVEAARVAAEQAAAAEAARIEAERLEAARVEAERVAALERAERERQERLAAEEAARLEAERIAAEQAAEAARVEAERVAAEAAAEAARLEAERVEAERVAAAAAAEAARLEAERIAAETAAAEAAAKAEAERLEKERLEAEANKPTPSPTPTPEPTPTPSATPTTEPTSTPSPTPTPEPTKDPTPTEQPVVVEIKEPITAENIAAVVAELATIAPQQLTQEQQTLITEAALETFETAEQGSAEYEAALDALLVVAQADDIVIDEELASAPVIGAAVVAVADAFNALGNAGADMSPQVREQSEKVVIAAVIVGQVAMTATAAATAAAASAGRRP